MGIEQHDAWVGDQRVHYRVAGSGPPMLLLHGVGEASASWDKVLPALGARHTVYAPDLPGCGDSTPVAPDGADVAPQRLAVLAAAFLDAVGVGSADPVAVVGNSLGGSTAIELAAQHPNRVRCLVLEDSAGLGRYVHPALRALTIPAYGDLAIRVARTRIGAAHRPWLRLPLLLAQPERAPSDWLQEQRRLTTLPHHLPAALAALRAQVHAFGQRRILLDVLPRLEMPTLVLWGAQDVLLPVTQALGAVALLKDGQLVVVPQCGHVPHLECPDEFLRALDRFITGVTS